MSNVQREERRRRILLVVTSESDDPALAALPDLSDDDVRVLAPLAQLSRTRWLTNDDEEERAAAEERADRIAEEVAPAAERAIGADDVILSIEDELRVFDAEEIWLITSPRTEANWLESGVHGRAVARLGKPIVRVLAHGRS